MSDYWNEIGLQCVENCKGKGMSVTAMCVKEIVEQRSELLEVLRVVQMAAFDMRGEDFNLTTEQWAMFHTTIAKAEASE